jgi:hypothetical protein
VVEVARSGGNRFVGPRVGISEAGRQTDGLLPPRNDTNRTEPKSLPSLNLSLEVSSELAAYYNDRIEGSCTRPSVREPFPFVARPGA